MDRGGTMPCPKCKAPVPVIERIGKPLTCPHCKIQLQTHNPETTTGHIRLIPVLDAPAKPPR